MAANAKIESMDEVWRTLPHTYAEKLSGVVSENWIPYDYLKIISREIVSMIAAGGGKLIVEVPPRHGKSTLISHWVPVWFLDLFPQKKVMLATYQAEFAAKWGRSVRNEIQGNPGVHVKIAQDSSAANRWDTEAGGGMVTAGIGGSVTGKGGHLIIIDDPVKNWQEAESKVIQKRNIDWMKSTMRTRAEPGCVFVVLQTRWHQKDLAGQLQADESQGYKVIRFPAVAEKDDPLGREIGKALCPERYSEDDLAAIKTDIGTRFFNALYQQRPSPEEGDILKRSWWKFYNSLPEDAGRWLQSWDLSFTDGSNSDFTAGMTMCTDKANIYGVDMINERMGFRGAKRAIKSQKKKWPRVNEVLVEKAANGYAVIEDLKDEVSGVIGIKPKGSKSNRIEVCAPIVESGNFYLPDPDKNPWVMEFIEQCAVFPNGANDDMIDAWSQGTMRLKGNKTDSISPVGIYGTSSWNT